MITSKRCKNADFFYHALHIPSNLSIGIQIFNCACPAPRKIVFPRIFTRTLDIFLMLLSFQFGKEKNAFTAFSGLICCQQRAETQWQLTWDLSQMKGLVILHSILEFLNFFIFVKKNMLFLGWSVDRKVLKLKCNKAETTLKWKVWSFYILKGNSRIFKFLYFCKEKKCFHCIFWADLLPEESWNSIAIKPTVAEDHK